MQSFFNRVVSNINRNFHKLWFFIVTFFNKCYAISIGVEIQTNVCFRGWTSFFLEKNSKIKIGKNCVFNSSNYTNHIGLNHKCILSSTPSLAYLNSELIIGDNCGFSGTSIWCFKKIVIGNNVRCGANTLIMDGDAHFDDIRTSSPQPIFIKDNVFIGANVVIKKGVTIGANSVVGMNSVVTHDIPANSVVAGVPAKVVKYLTT